MNVSRRGRRPRSPNRSWVWPSSSVRSVLSSFIVDSFWKLIGDLPPTGNAASHSWGGKHDDSRPLALIRHDARGTCPTLGRHRLGRHVVQRPRRWIGGVWESTVGSDDLSSRTGSWPE
jgi:hypothetical protein